MSSRPSGQAGFGRELSLVDRLDPVLAAQAAQLEGDDALWKIFCAKMDAVWENDEIP